MSYESKYKGKQVDDNIDKIANMVLIEATLNDSVTDINYLLSGKELLDDSVTGFNCTDTRFTKFGELMDYYLANSNQLTNHPLFQITFSNANFKISSIFQITWTRGISTNPSNDIVYLSGNIEGRVMIMWSNEGEVETIGFSEDSLTIKIEDRHLASGVDKGVSSFSEFLAKNEDLGNISYSLDDLITSLYCNIPGISNFLDIFEFLRDNSNLGIKQANIIFEVNGINQRLSCSVCRDSSAFGFSFIESDSYSSHLFATTFGERDDKSYVILVQELGVNYLSSLSSISFATLSRARLYNYNIKASLNNTAGNAFNNIEVLRSKWIFDGLSWNQPSKVLEMNDIYDGFAILTPLQTRLEKVWQGSLQVSKKVVRGTIQITAMTSDQEPIIGQGSFEVVDGGKLELTIQTTTFYS